MNTLTRGIGLMLAASVLLLAGCATPGGYGSYPGGGYGQTDPGYPSQYGSQLQGTVESVDPGYNRILVVVDDPRSGRAQRVVRYDQRTRLVYQGRESAVEGLERGDVIRFDAAQSGRELYARQIEVVRNVREGGYGGQYGGGYGNDLRGSVALVDARARVIRLDGAGYGNNVQLLYDARTTVEYQGRSYRPENLQRGDIVRIQARQVGNNQWLAERIIVERSVGY
ncbi:MAG: hypothetical protein EOP93_11695 [Lysobacteraceae bacterium]|nr:MAG: hypothetical protein EOP93_11695 [Xanthomonadaceae bacterium]